MATNGQERSRGEIGRAPRTRDRLITTWSPEQPNRLPVSSLDRQAIRAVADMKAMIETKGLPPWARDVENPRKVAQRAYIEMMLGDVDIPASQSIDDMWLKTSHFWINTYRVHAKRVESQIASLDGTPRKDHPLLAELNKTHTHYRQALKNEEVTYRNLITELVKRWQLEPLVKKQLRRVGIKVRTGDTIPATPISASEKQEKLRLVSYALCSLGDMQRYRAQLKVQMVQASGEMVQSVQDVHARARDYYDTARFVDYESGSAYHQLAVYCSLLRDDFGTTYYLIRAATCKQPWGKIEDELANRMQKALEMWQTDRALLAEGFQRPNTPENQLKLNFMAIMGMLYLSKSSSRFAPLDEQCRHDLADALSKRLLSSETIAQLVVTLLGVHWHVRTNFSVITGGSSAQKRQESEQAALSTVLLLFCVMFQVASSELEQVRANLPEHYESAIVDDEQQLSQCISSVLRRLLPSFRIASKWIKLNFDYIARLSELHLKFGATFLRFWNTYSIFVATLVKVFPIHQLPSITGPLEEDIDLRGFGPLSRGLTTHGGRRLDETAGTDAEEDAPHDKDEEQLMRISDILVDMMLIVDNATAMGLESPFKAEEHDSDDEAYGSNADEGTQDDDPVSMAFRAVVDDGGSIGFGPDGSSQAGHSTDTETDDEEIVFQPAHTPTQDPAFITPPASAGARAVHDMMQQITRGVSSHTITTRESPTMPPRGDFVSRPAGSGGVGGGGGASGGGGGGESSPSQGLFGFGLGSSMWTMSREESDKGMNRPTSLTGQPRPDPRAPGTADAGPSLIHPSLLDSGHNRRQSAERQLGVAGGWRDPSSGAAVQAPSPLAPGSHQQRNSIGAAFQSPWSQGGGEFSHPRAS